MLFFVFFLWPLLNVESQSIWIDVMFMIATFRTSKRVFRFSDVKEAVI